MVTRLGSRCRRGFTLVELIACLIVVGIIAAIAAPRFFDHRAFVARGYADDIASTLRYARRIAVASGCKVQVTIDAAGYSAWQPPALASCNGSAVWTTPVVRPDGTPLNGATPTGVTVAPATIIVFWPNGAATGAGTISVGTHVVNVDGATGRVSMQ